METTTETKVQGNHALEAAPTPPPSKSLLAALVVAQHEANPVTKSARNEHHRYNYASADAIIQEAGEALSLAGLAAFPAAIERDPEAIDHVWKSETDKDGVVTEYIDRPRRVRMVLCVVHGATGESREFVSSVPVIPEKGRPEDKAEFGARTEMLAYALRDLLLLPRLAENTPSERDDRAKPEPRAQLAQKPNGGQPPKGQGASSAPAAATRGAAGNASTTTAGAGTAAAGAAADPELAADLKKIRDCVGNELKWDRKTAVSFLQECFGVDSTDKLSRPQAAVCLQLVLAGVDGPEAYKSVKAKALKESPGLFVKGAAA